ncbi:copper chaperone [Azomonas agilis]|uniref:Copper chaperone n=1 Tax=Azomonas agilis TaxID=116849 RepID=A0A562I006_9GAMM|nr:cation transporter [Azomonas agilis]TWH64351.1 copper chaperone [Azomonas agilis]
MQVFKVQGMTCGHCERAVTQAIQAQDAQAKVEIDRAAGVVQVNSQLSEQQIRALIQEEGFQVL